MRDVHPRARLIFLAAILVLAAVLRFDHLWQRGLIYWDEAKFALEGIRYEQALRMLAGLTSHPQDGKAVGTAKPTHALLLGVAYTLLGIHDYAGLYLDAACSLGSVMMLYLIARRLFDSRVALCASLLLAVSAYEIVYARSDLSESDACLLFLVAVWIWALGREPGTLMVRARFLWPTVGSALALSLCFTTNYRAIVYIGVLVAFDLITRALARGVGHAARVMGVWGAGLISVPILWVVIEAIGMHAGIQLFRDEFTGGVRPYLAQVLYQLHQGKQSSFQFQPLIYVEWFTARETSFALVPLAVGVLVAVWKRTPAALLATALFLVPYGVYVFAPFVVPRNLELALPFAFLVMALGTVAALDRMRGWLLAVALACLAVLVVAEGLLSADLLSVRSGFAEAAVFIRDHGGRAATATEITVFYLNPTGTTCTAPALARSLRGLGRQEAAGFQLAVLERHQQTSVSSYIASHDHLVLRALALGRGTLSDDLINSENSGPPPGASGSEYVDVYRLHAPAPGTIGRTIRCSRDLVI